MTTPTDKMTSEEYALYSAINHADDEWTEEASAELKRIKAKAWREGADICGCDRLDLIERPNPYED